MSGIADLARAGGPLPVGGLGRNSVGWWGMLCLIATEASLFAYLLFGYGYIAVQRGPAFLPEAHPSLALAGPNTLILLSSSVAAWWGEEGARLGRPGRQAAGLGAAIALGLAFLGVQIQEWRTRPYSLTSSAYGSMYFTITGFHMAHVIVGVGALALLLLWSRLGCFSPRRYEPVSIGVLYWHFVDAVWLCVFTTFYVVPYLT